MNEFQPPILKIVCAAIRLEDGLVIASMRHYDVIMRAVCKKLLPEYGQAVWAAEQGFIDNQGCFLNRKTAYVVAMEAGQIPEDKLTGQDLFSEDLY